MISAQDIEVTREVTISEDDVSEWCDDNDEWNPIHTDPEVAGVSSFGQRIVPAMMILDQLSGMVNALGDGDQEEIFLSGITAARYRDPVLLGETVRFALTNVEEGSSFTTADFEARVQDRGSLVMNGALSLVVD